MILWNSRTATVWLFRQRTVTKFVKRSQYKSSGTYVEGSGQCNKQGSDKKCQTTGGDTSDPPNMYQERKYSPCLPVNDPCRCLVFHPPPEVSTGVFRIHTGEVLGPCASPCNTYKNAEYFAYHNMSYYDINICLFKFRKERINSFRKQR